MPTDAMVQPYPDLLLERGGGTPAPEDAVAEREQVGLALVTAMRLLPPKQRVVVLLRDGLGWAARDVAELLGDSVAAVNSALQRGRERLEREARERSLGSAHRPSAAVEQAVMRTFEQAWAELDFDGIVALLADDALLRMPPEAISFHGAEAIRGFVETTPLDGRLDRIRLVATSANRQRPSRDSTPPHPRLLDHRRAAAFTLALEHLFSKMHTCSAAPVHRGT